jgi:hypothetical protein
VEEVDPVRPVRPRGPRGRPASTDLPPLLWDLCGGRLVRLLEPGRLHDTNSPAVADVPPAGSLTIRDLGYFDLSRFRAWAARGAHWLSRWQPGARTFHPDGRPLNLLGHLRRHPTGGPFDVPFLPSAADRLACRLIALRAPQEEADRRRQKGCAKAQMRGREHRAWCLDGLRDRLPGGAADREGGGGPVPGPVADRAFVRDLGVTQRPGDAPGSPGVGAALGELWAKLIGVVPQHRVLLVTCWPAVRRSLWKAAGVVRTGLALLPEAADDLDRLTAVLTRLRATVAARKKHPSNIKII